jgi:hypothetical protein
MTEGRDVKYDGCVPIKNKRDARSSGKDDFDRETIYPFHPGPITIDDVKYPKE